MNPSSRRSVAVQICGFAGAGYVRVRGSVFGFERYVCARLQLARGGFTQHKVLVCQVFIRIAAHDLALPLIVQLAAHCQVAGLGEALVYRARGQHIGVAVYHAHRVRPGECAQLLKPYAHIVLSAERLVAELAVERVRERIQPRQRRAPPVHARQHAPERLAHHAHAPVFGQRGHAAYADQLQPAPAHARLVVAEQHAAHQPAGLLVYHAPALAAAQQFLLIGGFEIDIGPDGFERACKRYRPEPVHLVEPVRAQLFEPHMRPPVTGSDGGIIIGSLRPLAGSSVSFVIPLAGEYRHRAIYLLQQHHAHQLVRERQP